ncbi:hypothetical protein [Devosia sp.]|uniref:hypothetical protein n=1 Tax=Devosia sp. TaxID=1871048 RepID=UPI0032661B4A
MTRGQAAFAANVTRDTISNWCIRYAIGRQMEAGSPWRVALAAALMVSAANRPALDAFKSGDRTSELVMEYIGAAAFEVAA